MILLFEDEAVHHLGEAELVVEHTTFVLGILGVVFLVEVAFLAELLEEVRGALEVCVVATLGRDHHDALPVCVLLETRVETVVAALAHAVRDRVDVLGALNVHGWHGASTSWSRVGLGKGEGC